MFCAACGTPAIEGGSFCTHCGKALAQAGTASPGTAGPGTAGPGTAGPGTGGAGVMLEKPSAPANAIPDGVRGWSWGAFLLNWVWAIGNRTWIGLLALIPYVGIFVSIWLGIKGRELAWQNKQWDSLEHFNRVQKTWSRWGAGLLIASLLLGIAGGIALVVNDTPEKRAIRARIALETDAPDAAEAAGAADAESAEDDAAPAPGPASGAGADRGTIDSNADTLPTALITSAGMLKRVGESYEGNYVSLNGKQLFKGADANWQFPVRSFTLSGDREAILMASSGGRGNSCETMFFFLLIEGKSVRHTPQFGTCAPQGSFVQRDDSITLELPRMGGMSTFELREGNVLEDGKAVTLDDSNDPAK